MKRITLAAYWIATAAAFAFVLGMVLGIGGQAMADCSLKPTWGCIP
jgi:hypothetical protein